MNLLPILLITLNMWFLILINRFFITSIQIKSLIDKPSCGQSRSEMSSSIRLGLLQANLHSLHLSCLHLLRQVTEWTLEDDGEPDIDFPQPVPGEKGVKIDRLTILRHDGGLVNYHNWLSDVTRAFKADPPRFNAAVKRVVFATSWFDQKMKSIWVGESKKRPHLEDHWLKFLRWIDKTHLHGDSDLIYQLNQYQDAMQGPNEEPKRTTTYLKLVVSGPLKLITSSMNSSAYLST